MSSRLFAGQRARRRIRRVIASIAGAASLSFAPALPASPVRVYQIQGSSAFLAGTFEGVRLDDLGALTVASERQRVARIVEPFAFSFVELPDGWAVGTGNDGKVLKVTRDGKVSELFDAAEADVFALWADADGTLFAGTSPDGKVYRIRDGSAAAYFAPGATYIWAIARGADGALWVATGVEGKLFRVDDGGHGELAWDASEPHLRSLLSLPGGDLLIGTAGQGRVVRRSASGGAITTVYDSALAEVVALARAANGALFAAVVASEASYVELEPRPARDPVAVEVANDAVALGEAEGDAVLAGAGAGAGLGAGSRPAGARGPRSELVRLLDAGISEPLWSSQDETLFALAPDGDRLWLATGAEGRLYSLYDDAVRFEQDFDERQIVGLLPGADGPALLTTNEAALYHSLARPRERGTYTASVADAAQPARYGLLRWLGERPAGAAFRFAFRAGLSATPDDSWSDWSSPVAVSGTTSGEVPVPAAVAGRYLQWRVELVAGSGGLSPRLAAVELSYRQINQRPRIERFGALEPGQIQVAANFNPGEQAFEPVTPNRDGIFTTLQPAAGGAEARTKTLWKRGMRTLRWRATDANADELRSKLSVRRDEAGANQGEWLPMVDDWKEDSYGFDAAALPDGRYRFRLEVTDALGNPGADALQASEESEPVIIDHSPPARRGVDRRGGRIRLEIADDWNPLRQAQVSIDAGEWRDLAPVDGLLDGRAESVALDALPRDARMVLLRVSDAAWNTATFDLGAELVP